jgi:hypothetical protein
MMSPAIALEQFTYASEALKRAPVCRARPVVQVPVVRNAAFCELVEEIRRQEGAEVSSPMLFNLVVAVGFAILAVGIPILASGAVRLAGQLL